MTVPTTTRRSPVYTGNGVTTAFPFAFKVFANTDIQVQVTSLAGTISTAVLGSDYTVTLNGDQTVAPGGTINYLVAPAAGVKLVALGNLPYNQTLSLPGGGNFNPAAIENAFDRTEIQIQQLAAGLESAVTVPAGEVAVSLPSAAVRANYMLGFDAAGNPVVLAPASGSSAALAADLASAVLVTKNAGQVGFNGLLNYAVNTIGWAQLLGGIIPEWFGAVGDGVTDDTAALASAIAFTAALAGPQYGDSMGQAPYQYGASRRLKLTGKKYLINSTLTLTGDVGIYAEGGGFLAGAGFPAAAYMVDTGADPYGGRVSDLTLDGGDRNVKGVRVRNAHATRWRGLSVVSCRNDGIVYESGAEFFLDGFEVSGAATPIAVTVAGLRVLASDGHFLNGVIKYTPIGVAGNGGGNNEYVAVHTWGLYAAFKQYVGFWMVNSVRNSFTSCYADSPAKQDYLQAATTTLNGIPNGGVGWYLDSTSAQNQIIGCRGYVNTTAWAAFAAAWSGATAYTAGQLVVSGGITYVCILGHTNQVPPNAAYWTATTTNQFYDIYCAGQFNSVVALIHNYAGNWLSDVLFDSVVTRDSCFLAGTPNTPNGLRASVVAAQANAAAGTVRLAVINTDAGTSAASSAQVAFNVNNTDIGADVALYGAGGVSSIVRNVNGTERHRSTARGLELTGGNLVLKTGVAAVSAGEVAVGNNTAATVGAAGGASALPATPLGYLSINVGGTFAKIPYYNN